jgi:hypothetical protein
MTQPSLDICSLCNAPPTHLLCVVSVGSDNYDGAVSRRGLGLREDVIALCPDCLSRTPSILSAVQETGRFWVAAESDRGTPSYGLVEFELPRR